MTNSDESNLVLIESRAILDIGDDLGSAEQVPIPVIAVIKETEFEVGDPKRHQGRDLEPGFRTEYKPALAAVHLAFPTHTNNPNAVKVDGKYFVVGPDMSQWISDRTWEEIESEVLLPHSD